MRILSLLLLLTVCLPLPAQQPAATPARVSLTQFRQLRWILGRWRGSGGAYPAFYESYTRRDDSTIVMHAFPDSTFKRPGRDSSIIEWRRGRVRSRNAGSVYDVIEFTPRSVRFQRSGAPRSGHLFERISANEWTATLFPGRPGADPVVYRMLKLPDGPGPR